MVPVFNVREGDNGNYWILKYVCYVSVRWMFITMKWHCDIILHVSFMNMYGNLPESLNLHVYSIYYRSALRSHI